MARQTAVRNISDTSQTEAIELPQPEWTHEECVDYEVARECVTELIAHRNSWIYQKQRKENPDRAIIERWEGQARQYMKEIDYLSVKDSANIERIQRDYGLECKRLMANPELRD